MKLKVISAKMRPWYVPEAIDYLEKTITNYSNLTVFEFGGGKSTLYWLRLGCRVVTIEDSPGYAEEILKNLSDESLESRLTLIVTPRPYHREFGIRLSINSFDVVVVDGRDRSLCMSEVRRNLNFLPRYFVLDNSERKHYQEEFQELSRYYDFKNFSHRNGWTTSVGIRNDFHNNL